MPLNLRPTGLGSGIDKDRGTHCRSPATWDVGRIYENAPALTICAAVATLEEAKVQFQKVTGMPGRRGVPASRTGSSPPAPAVKSHRVASAELPRGHPVGDAEKGKGPPTSRRPLPGLGILASPKWLGGPCRVTKLLRPNIKPMLTPSDRFRRAVTRAIRVPPFCETGPAFFAARFTSAFDFPASLLHIEPRNPVLLQPEPLVFCLVTSWQPSSYPAAPPVRDGAKSPKRASPGRQVPFWRLSSVANWRGFFCGVGRWLPRAHEAENKTGLGLQEDRITRSVMKRRRPESRKPR